MRIILALLMIVVSVSALRAAEDGSIDHKQIKFFKPYPLTTCVVSGEAFGGDMGEPLSFVHDGQEYTICCKGCIKRFAKNPQKYAEKVKLATEKKPVEKKEPAAEHSHGGAEHKH